MKYALSRTVTTKQEPWYKTDPETIAQHLASDLGKGLSVQTARERLRQNGKNGLFSPPKSSFAKSLWKESFTGAGPILAIGVSLVGLLFDAVGTVLPSIFLWTALLIFTISVGLHGEKASREKAEYSMPMVRVLRDGKMIETLAQNVVIGDVILLRRGDIVPADCRLVRSDRLSVDTLTQRAKGLGFVRQTKNAGTVYAVGDILGAPEPETMVYGGSVVVSGRALAIAVAVGDMTHIGALNGFVPPMKTKPDANRSERFSSYHRKAETVMLLAVIPLCLIAAFVRLKSGLLDPILRSILLLTAVGGDCICLFPRLFLFAGVNEIETKKTVLIKDPSVLASASDITDLFLFGRTALCDGVMQTESAFWGGKNQEGSGLLSPSLDILFEYACIAENGLKLFSGHDASPFADSLWQLGSERMYDAEAFAIRMQSAESCQMTVAGASLNGVEYAFGGKKRQIVMMEDVSDWSDVPYCLDAEGKKTEMNGEVRLALENAVLDAREKGNTVRLYLTLDGSGDSVLVGGFFFTQKPFADLKETLSGFKAVKIAPTLFLDENDSVAFDLLNASGALSCFRGKVECRNIEETGKKLNEIFKPNFLYVGFDPDDIASLEKEMAMRNRKIACLGLRPGEFDPAKACRISFACDLIEYPSERWKDAGFDTLSPSGNRDSDRCSSSLRAQADVLVARRAQGGALHGISSVLKASRSYRQKTAALLYFSVASSLTWFTVTALSLLFGISSPSAPSIAFFGLGFEIAVAALMLSAHDNEKSRRHEAEKRMVNPLQNAVPVIFCAAVVWLFAKISVSLGNAYGISGYLTLSCFLLSLVYGNKAIRRYRLTGNRVLSALVHLGFAFCAFAFAFIPQLAAYWQLEGIFARDLEAGLLTFTFGVGGFSFDVSVYWLISFLVPILAASLAAFVWVPIRNALLKKGN